MSTFAATFRDLVQPALERECYVRATFVALGMTEFAEAERTVRGVAYAHGAAYLPQHLHDSLTDWLLARLLHHVAAAEKRARAAREISDRVAAGIAAWEAACRTMRTL